MKNKTVTTKKKNKFTVEDVDDLTNEIMDDLRTKYPRGNEDDPEDHTDSDADDEEYTVIHNIARKHLSGVPLKNENMQD